MEITIWKQQVDGATIYNTTIYETYKSSTDKKQSITIVTSNKFLHTIKIAYNVIKNYKWLSTSNTIEVVKSKKYFNTKPKSNKNKK